MNSAFFNVFLGLLFQLNFYAFKGIDILPDIVGYYFIYKGLKTLATENDYFALANKLVLPLLVLSIVKLYNFQYHQDLLLTISLGLDIIKIIVFALNMYLIYNLCQGAIKVAESINDEYLEKTIGQRLYLFLGVAGFLLVLSIISLLPFVGVVTTMQSVFTIIYFAYILVFLIMVAGIFSLYKELSPSPVKTAKTKAGGKTGKSKRKR
jgi:hypothetical protein